MASFIVFIKKTTMKNLIYLLLMFSIVQAQSLTGQDIKIMSYNILTFPEEGGIDRTDTLGKIIRYYEPDIFLLQELKSEEGFQNILAECNEWKNEYSGGTYAEQISNPTNNWRLQQNIIFNNTKFTLTSESVIVTDYRDVNYFKLYRNSSDQDSIFLHIYNTHLKSSSGFTNEQLRLGMAEYIIDHIETLPTDSKILVAGDFNVYDGDEPALKLLVSETGTNQLHDPIQTLNWAVNPAQNADVLTQSAYASSPGNGAGGGIDDRFDWILISSNLKQPSSLAYKPDTYKALGNNGQCYNSDLLDCIGDNDVPEGIIRTLWNMSDHIPVVMELGQVNMVKNVDLDRPLTLKVWPNPSSMELNIEWPNNSSGVIQMYDLTGKCILTQTIDSEQTLLDIRLLGQGYYIIKAKNKSGTLTQTCSIIK